MATLIFLNDQNLNKEQIEQIQNLCRLCLFQSKEIELYSDSYLPDKKWVDILMTISEPTNDKSLNDVNGLYPSGICEECSSKLVLFYKFKQKIETSYAILGNIFQKWEGDIQETEYTENCIELCKDSPKIDDEYLFDEDKEDDINEDALLDSYSNNDENIEYQNDLSKDVELNLEDSINENVIEFDPKVNNLSFDDVKIDYINNNPDNENVENEEIFYLLDCYKDDDVEKHIEENIENTTENYVNITETVDDPEINSQNDTVAKKNIECDLCGAKFTRKSSLKQHATVHTQEKNFSCHICAKRFTRRQHVDIHMRIHTNTKPYKCNICSKSFIKSSDLLRHKKIHSDVCDYICLICKKEFKRKEYLKAHINGHYSLKPHECEYCKKSYQTLSGLIKHKKALHALKVQT